MMRTRTLSPAAEAFPRHNQDDRRSITYRRISNCRATRIHFSTRILAVVLLLLAFCASAFSASTAAGSSRYIVVSHSTADFEATQTDIRNSGGQVLFALPRLHALVVLGGPAFSTRAHQSPFVRSIFPDRLVRIAPASPKSARIPMPRLATSTAVVNSVPPDPAMNLAGLMWNLNRINAPAYWKGSLGSPSVKVAIADTGIDYTHLEMTNQVASVVDMTLGSECDSLGLPTDAQLATAFGAPGSNLDFHGHGTFVAGTIAAALNKTGVNGIAPAIKLVSLKIAQNCGLAYDSTVIEAIMFAGDNFYDVLDLSFEDYLDLTNTDQLNLYNLYQTAVQYALSQGTIVVAPAGDDHTRIGAGGKVLRHGALSTAPGGNDFFGLYLTPGGIPGVVLVSGLSNIVKAPSATCPGDSLAAGTRQWCKPTSDAHKVTGVGLHNQLAYYSNYGPRIDYSAPGGARKFNLPTDDRGGCEGWAWCGTDSIEGGSSVVDGFNAWEVWSIVSDYATEVPCFTFTSNSTFPGNQCYGILQGTAMAASHVAGALAQVASTHPSLRHKPTNLLSTLAAMANPITGNHTKAVSATDTSNMDATGAACTLAFCHLGGTAIPDVEAFGKNGLVHLTPF